MIHFSLFRKPSLTIYSFFRGKKTLSKWIFLSSPSSSRPSLAHPPSLSISSSLKAHRSSSVFSFFRTPQTLNNACSKMLTSSSRRAYDSYKRRHSWQEELPWYHKKSYVFTALGSTIAAYYYTSHLEEVPITGRKRFIDFSPKEEERFGKSAYRLIIQQFGPAMLPPSHPIVLMVAEVAGKLIRAAQMDNLDWKVHVISSPEKNAFVLPGGLIFIFTGILPICKNEDGLAVVLGHEIAHQIARHSAEKMSFATILFVLQMTISLVFDTSMYFSQLLTQMLLSLPFSRKMENEADYIGLLLTANACYDPRVAIDVWERMAQATRINPPEFLSTHPNPSTRIERLRELMPQAIQKRKDAGCQDIQGYFRGFSKLKSDLF